MTRAIFYLVISTLLLYMKVKGYLTTKIFLQITVCSV